MKTVRPQKGFTFLELMVVLVVIGVIIGGISVWRGNKPKAKTELEQEPLKVQGFYVGMHTNELRPIIGASFPDWDFGRAVDQSDWFMLTRMPSDASRMFKDDIHVNFRFDNAGTVREIHFTPLATDAIFKSDNQSGSEFADNFMTGYGIKEMKGMKGGWYWNGKGVKLQIGSDKAINIQAFSPEDALQNFK